MACSACLKNGFMRHLDSSPWVLLAKFPDEDLGVGTNERRQIHAPLFTQNKCTQNHKTQTFTRNIVIFKKYLNTTYTQQSTGRAETKNEQNMIL